MIKYKLLKTQLTGCIYPQQVDSQVFTHDDLETILTNRYGGIASAVLKEAVRIITDKIADGATVSVDELGSFSVRLGLKNESVTDFDDVRTQDIRINGVRFNASKALRTKFENVDIHVERNAAVRREMTTEDRWVILYDHLLQEYRRNGYASVNVTTYRVLTGCSDYMARKELEQFAAEDKLQTIMTSKMKLYMLNRKLLKND